MLRAERPVFLYPGFRTSKYPSLLDIQRFLLRFGPPDLLIVGLSASIDAPRLKDFEPLPVPAGQVAVDGGAVSVISAFRQSKGMPRLSQPAATPVRRTPSGVIHIEVPKGQLRITECVDADALRVVLERLLG